MRTTLLHMEAEATRRGWKPLSPPTLRGRSGVEHPFGFLVVEGDRIHAFDFCDACTEFTLVGEFAKKFDTGVDVNLICLSGKVTEGARDLSSVYEIDIITKLDVAGFFDSVRGKQPRCETSLMH